MLPKAQPCRGPLSRRDFLQIGALGVGGLSLPTVVASGRCQRQSRAGPKSVIMIYMVGAPFASGHGRPQARRSARVPRRVSSDGDECPWHVLLRAHAAPRPHCRQAGRDSFAARFARWRSRIRLSAIRAARSATNRQGVCRRSVRRFQVTRPQFARPARVCGPRAESRASAVRFAGLPGFLGPAHNAFRPYDEAMADLQLQGITVDRLPIAARCTRSLMATNARPTTRARWPRLINTRRKRWVVNIEPSARSVGPVARRSQVRARYGQGDPRNYGDGAPRNLEHFLTARRLVEAGVRVVTLNFGRWISTATISANSATRTCPVRSRTIRLDRGLARARTR